MSESVRPSPVTYSQSSTVVEILERILDKGVVIVGDIGVSLCDIELLKITLRLLVCSVDKAKELGIDWWEWEPAFSSRAQPAASATPGAGPALAADKASGGGPRVQ